MKKKVRLPSDEVRFLSSLEPPALNNRIRALWKAGWSLKIIADSLQPPRPKSTVHFWVKNAADEEQRRPIPATPPKSLTTTAPLLNSPRLRSISPSVPPELKPHLQELALLASRYRAKTSPDSPYAKANQELTHVARMLYNRGVPAADIAEAAGITYRAIARRLANG
jgi:hypothetical protein